MAVSHRSRLYLAETEAYTDPGPDLTAGLLTTVVSGEKNSNLAPGGWVEFEDYDLQAKGWDHTVKDDDAPIVWDQLLIKACKQIGIEASPGEKLEKWVKEAGFVNVTHRVFKMPMNVWASDPLFKKIGGLMLINGLEGLEGFSLRLLCGVLGWTEAEVHLFLVDVRKKLKDRNWHGYWD